MIKSFAPLRFPTKKYINSNIFQSAYLTNDKKIPVYETFFKCLGCIPFLSFIFAKIIKMSKPITEFIEKYYLHFNAAALVDASKGYVAHLKDGGKMMITLAGAMSTAELGKILAEMIRQGKVDFISCTGANLEEDLMNLVAHTHYERVPTTEILHRRKNGICWKED